MNTKKINQPMLVEGTQKAMLNGAVMSFRSWMPRTQFALGITQQASLPWNVGLLVGQRIVGGLCPGLGWLVRTIVHRR